MAIPEGYTPLAKIGIAYKGNYKSGTAYSQYDAVYYEGSTYVALINSPSVPPAADGVNWQYMAKGFIGQVISSLSDIEAKDTNGVIGDAGKTVNAQNLLDGITEDLSGKLDDTGDAADTTVTFSEATTRTNINSKESQKTLMGKIKKWFADMTAAAFAQMITSYPDLMANTMPGYLVDALTVKAGFDAVNSNFTIIDCGSFVICNVIFHIYVIGKIVFITSFGTTNSEINIPNWAKVYQLKINPGFAESFGFKLFANNATILNFFINTNGEVYVVGNVQSNVTIQDSAVLVAIK